MTDPTDTGSTSSPSDQTPPSPPQKQKNRSGDQDALLSKQAHPLYHQTLQDVLTLTEYANEAGKALPQEIIPDLSALLSMHQDKAADHAPTVGQLTLALSVLSRLNAALTPVSPGGIEASNLQRNKTLKTIARLGFWSLAVTILSAVLYYGMGEKSHADKGWYFLSILILQIHLLTAAGLGAAFYALQSARPYIRDLTFDPRYNSVYVMRFMFGVMAGYILSQVPPEWLGLSVQQLDSPLNPTGASAQATNHELWTFYRAAMAFLGAFAADNVSAAMNRVTETFLAAIEGNSKARFQAEAKASAQQDLLVRTTQLSQAIDDIKPGDKPEEIQQKLRSSLQNITP
ncbi:MAG: hypothetical protein ACPGOY_16640 [Rhodospirillaceae bacterium]